MTTVNWERLSGDEVERIACALMMLDNPSANRITPSRGDQGVDFRIDTPNGVHVYQVKRFSRSLTSAQRQEVIGSWERFVDQFMPHHKVLSWTLVCPWDPTPERLEWLSELTSGLGRWLGRTQLDVLAATRPEVIDYYVGDGNRRTQKLMTLALRAGPIDGSDAMARPALLDGLLAQTANIAALLNEVDPFYRYEVEVRAGRVDGSHWAGLNGATHVRYITVSAEQYLILRIYQLSAESQWLRPMSFTVQFRVPLGTPEYAALDNFRQFGAPFDGVTGIVTHAEGPPGAVMSPGDGVFSVATAASLSDDHGLAEAEFRVMDGDETVARVDLVNVELTFGADGPGRRIAGRDRAGLLEVETRMGVPDRSEELLIEVREVGSVSPRDVLAAAEVLVAMPGRQAEIGIRGGPTLSHRWDLPQTDEQAQIGRRLQRICRDLLTVQAHTVRRILLPSALSDPWIAHLRAVAKVIAGDIVDWEWAGLDFAAPTEEIPDWAAAGEFGFVRDEHLRVLMNDESIETDVKIRYTATARMTSLPETGGLDAHTSMVRLVPARDRLCRIRQVPPDDAEPWSPQFMRFHVAGTSDV